MSRGLHQQGDEPTPSPPARPGTARNLTIAEQNAQAGPPLPDRCWHCYRAPCGCPPGLGLRDKERR